MMTARTIQSLRLSRGASADSRPQDDRLHVRRVLRRGLAQHARDGRGPGRPRRHHDLLDRRPRPAQRARPQPRRAPGDLARATNFDTGDDGPNILTAGTGGFMVRNIDDISRAFGIIVRDTSTYYVIGYQPDNPTMDGKFRKIEVKSKIPG